MFAILVYDTAVERNPRVLKTCRQYLHWVQNSVFQGELSSAQYRRLMTTLKSCIDPEHDGIRAYTARSPGDIDLTTLGHQSGNHDSVL